MLAAGGTLWYRACRAVQAWGIATSPAVPSAFRLLPQGGWMHWWQTMWPMVAE